jgi:hypothetical protein
MVTVQVAIGHRKDIYILEPKEYFMKKQLFVGLVGLILSGVSIANDIKLDQSYNAFLVLSDARMIHLGDEKSQTLRTLKEEGCKAVLTESSTDRGNDGQLDDGDHSFMTEETYTSAVCGLSINISTLNIFYAKKKGEPPYVRSSVNSITLFDNYLAYFSVHGKSLGVGTPFDSEDMQGFLTELPQIMGDAYMVDVPKEHPNIMTVNIMKVEKDGTVNNWGGDYLTFEKYTYDENDPKTRGIKSLTLTINDY